MSAIKLTPAKCDIDFTVGTDLDDLYLTFVDDAGVAVDISGYTIAAQVLRGTTVLVTDFTTAVSGAGNNVLQLAMTDPETTTIGVERGLTWSLRMTSGGITKEWVAGEFVGYVQGAARTGNGATTRVFTVGDVTVTFSTVAPLATILAAVATDIGTPASAISTALAGQYGPHGRTVFTQRPYEVINDGIYTAWPNGCLFVDEANEIIGQAYTDGDSHVDTGGTNNKIAYFRSQGFNAAEPGAAVVISDVTGSTLDSTVHGCGIAANGDYLATVRHSNGTTQALKLYRSTDQGATWDAGTQMVDTLGANMLFDEASQLFLTAAGSLLVGMDDAIGRNASADGSGQWLVVDVNANGVSNTTLEGNFAQLNDGTIICLAREAVRAAPYAQRRAVFIKSTDDGVTWSPAEWAADIWMSANPCTLIHHADSDQVEVFSGDRYPLNGDGFGSIWHYITSGANAALNVFGDPTRIMVGYPSKDFGYPAAVKLPDGRVLLRWYDDENGGGTNTAIYEMWGERPTGS